METSHNFDLIDIYKSKLNYFDLHRRNCHSKHKSAVRAVNDLKLEGVLGDKNCVNSVKASIKPVVPENPVTGDPSTPHYVYEKSELCRIANAPPPKKTIDRDFRTGL